MDHMFYLDMIPRIQRIGILTKRKRMDAMQLSLFLLWKIIDAAAWL